MVFSSIEFIFFFLPFSLALFFIFKKRFKFLVLLILSAIFYAWGDSKALWVILLSSVIDFFCGLNIEKYRYQGSIKARYTLFLSIAVNLSLLMYFKYAGFIAENLVSVGIDEEALNFMRHVSLPLGISFYTFQSMSYSIDVYWGEVKATKDFSKFASYVTCFPQLVAGPIVRYRDIESQLKNHSVSISDIYEGFVRFSYGLSKKVLVANTCGLVADEVFKTVPTELNVPAAWVGIIAYTFQIYFDFSGYSDMAIGLGRVFGFRYVENFNYPYIATSVTDFWRRWHISLSTWWKDYVYKPLGGNRVGIIKNYRNLFIVFFLCGLWHGASWTFVFWGFYHGLFLVLEKLFLLNLFSQIPNTFTRLYTLLVVMVGWVYFRSENIQYANNFVLKLFDFNNTIQRNYTNSSINNLIDKEVLFFFIIAFIFSAPTYKFLDWTPF